MRHGAHVNFVQAPLETLLRTVDHDAESQLSGPTHTDADWAWS